MRDGAEFRHLRWLRQPVHLYWMLRKGWDYEQMLQFVSPAGSHILVSWCVE